MIKIDGPHIEIEGSGEDILINFMQICVCLIGVLVDDLEIDFETVRSILSKNIEMAFNKYKDGDISEQIRAQKA